ncbi:N-acetyltransferase family protein [Azospirillum sp. ST 5-10]|uniref:GNAT family N-acetyltransferase n=1 Tax=unclassified Azospirillum TaxID=2630922 RepID=UPI003F4A1DDD
MAADIRIRPAEPHDAPAIAPLVLAAGGGVYEFLLDGLVPGMDAGAMLVPGIAGRAGSFSHRHMAVAEAAGRVVGVAHAHPTDWMRDADRSFIPTDRLAHLEPFDNTQDWGSHFLSALAVEPGWRRHGLARRLLAWSYHRAAEGGYDRLTLHVWADNAAARSLYAGEGFTEVAVAAIPWHARLPHDGGSVLLRRSLAR